MQAINSKHQELFDVIRESGMYILKSKALGYHYLSAKHESKTLSLLRQKNQR